MSQALAPSSAIVTRYPQFSSQLCSIRRNIASSSATSTRLQELPGRRNSVRFPFIPPVVVIRLALPIRQPFPHWGWRPLCRASRSAVRKALMPVSRRGLRRIEDPSSCRTPPIHVPFARPRIFPGIPILLGDVGPLLLLLLHPPRQ